MTVEALKRKYKDEWVLAEVLETDAQGHPTRVRLIAHSKNRDEVYRALRTVPDGKHVCTLYTGEIPKKGYAVVFSCRK